MMTPVLASGRAQAHPDGGSVRVLADAETINGFRIVLTAWWTSRGRLVHEVLRWSPELGSSVRLEVVEAGEAAARARANAWWAFDRGTGPHPTHRRIA